MSIIEQLINNSTYFAAAYEVAKEAHKDEKRRDDSPYIVHPELTAEILHRFGAPLQSIVEGVLHDVMENQREKYPSAAALEAAYLAELEKQETPGLPSSRKEQIEFARQVSEGVAELTHVKHEFGTKRMAKVDGAHMLRSEARKKVRVADQTATVIEDILKTNVKAFIDFKELKRVSEEDANKPAAQEARKALADPKNAVVKAEKKAREALKANIDVALKARDVVSSCNLEQNDRFSRLFALCYADLSEIYTSIRDDNPEYALQVQQKFDLKQKYSEALTSAAQSHHDEAQGKRYWSPLVAEKNQAGGQVLTQGISSVTLSKTSGRVKGFSLLVTREEKSEINTLAVKIMDALEQERGVFVVTHPLQKIGGQGESGMLSRDIIVSPPVTLAYFLKAVEEVPGAMDGQFTQLLQGFVDNGLPKFSCRAERPGFTAHKR